MPTFPDRPCRLLAVAPFAASLLVALALQGCGTAPGRPSGPASPTGPASPASPAQESAQRMRGLAVERQWLQSWFKDTPVSIAQPGDDSVTVAVPLAFSFDKGRTVVKPALAAVLDKTAESLRRLPAAQLRLVAAPGDAGEPALALRRAQAVRKHLQSRGVAPERLGAPSAADAPAVQLRIEIAPG